MDDKIKIIKRDGRKQKFNDQKIRNAISNAFKSCEIDDEEFVDNITKNVCEKVKDEMTVEEIQDMVEFELMKSRYKQVAKSYILYRDDRTKTRENKSKLMKNVAEKLMATNIVNQNANVDEASFGGRKGEANNEVMKWFALNNCMSKKSKENHENNRIYIHDLDSYSIGQHNCFDRSTRFITSEGVKSFDDCSDGQEVIVLNKNGNWSPATVHMYGKQKMYDLLFTSGSTEKKVCCTRDHRWILSDGTVTTNIQVGDKLILNSAINTNFQEDLKMWCFGFVLGDGCDYNSKSKDKTKITSHGMKVRLCGDKIKYSDNFKKIGWSINKVESGSTDVEASSRRHGAFKQVFIKNEIWKIMSENDLANIFNGYLAADGFIKENGSVCLSTSDLRMVEFIKYSASTAGYYVWSISEKIGDTNFKKNRKLYNIFLSKCQVSNNPWILKEIKSSKGGLNGEKTAWCVDEPETHSFTLDGGMVTGNCLSIPFDDLLAKGFNTRQTDIRPASSIGTAFQLVAVIFQLQSLQQFGGVSATHLDWTMVPYVRRSFRKHFLDGLRFIDEYSEEKINEIAKSIDKDTPIDNIIYNKSKAYKYAFVQTEKELKQAVEGMYHNLNY